MRIGEIRFFTNMDKRCKPNLHFLKFLVLNNRNDMRLSMLQLASPEQLRCVLEVIANVLYGNIRIPPETLRKLKKHKQFLVKLWRGRDSLKRKRVTLKENYKIIRKVLDSAKPFFSSL